MRIPDHYVRVVELPAAVRGVTVPNDDGTFSVYINALYDDESQRETLEHELASLKDLESYLRRIGALDKPIEDLGRPLW